MLKKKSTRIFSPGLPNLCAQIRCAQNRYTAFQTDLKYPLFIYLSAKSCNNDGGISLH